MHCYRNLDAWVSYCIMSHFSDAGWTKLLINKLTSHKVIPFLEEMHEMRRWFTAKGLWHEDEMRLPGRCSWSCPRKMSYSSTLTEVTWKNCGRGRTPLTSDDRTEKSGRYVLLQQTPFFEVKSQLGCLYHQILRLSRLKYQNMTWDIRLDTDTLIKWYMTSHVPTK